MMRLGDIERFILLLIAAAVVAVAAEWACVSYTLALLLLGLALGLADLVPAVSLSSDVILLLFLPPLLFEAAFVLDLRLLARGWRGVTLLAGPGVLVATVVGAAVVHWATGLQWSLAFLFGSMIAATDPVAVLAAVRRLHVDERLAVLLEGESLFNDGVALVLFLTLVDAVTSGFHTDRAGEAFVISVIGGVAVGLAVAAVGHYLIALADDHLNEMIVSVAVAYGAFLGAEHLELSGVLATLAAAMTLGRFGRSRGWVFSDNSERLLTDLWAFLAFVANAALFLLMGLSVRLLGEPSYVLWGIVAALVGRASVAYGLGPLLRPRGTPSIWAERHLLFWGGLRGAVALAAALSLPPTIPHRPQLRAMTYGVVLFTLLAQGLTVGPLIRRLGLQERPQPAVYIALSIRLRPWRKSGAPR